MNFASSFFLCRGQDQQYFDLACRSLFPCNDQYSVTYLGSLVLAVNGKSRPDVMTTSFGDMVVISIGAGPVDFERLLASIQDSGFSMLPVLHESGYVIVIDRTSNKCIVSNGRKALWPVNFYSDEKTWVVTSEAKVLQYLAPGRLTLKDFDAFTLDKYFKPDDHHLLKNCSRLPYRQILEIDIETGHHKYAPSMPEEVQVHNDLESNIEKLHELLKSATKDFDNSETGVLVSGGCDSGLLAGMIAKITTGFNSFTIGTGDCNEFREAEEISNYIGSRHHEIIINPEGLVRTIVHGIYLNELSDPVYAEGYSGLYAAYRAASGINSKLITGYGADLTLSNFTGGPLNDMSELSYKSLARARWTGELSPYVAAFHGIHAEHPFLNPEIAEFITELPTGHKVHGSIEKFIEKELISRFSYMPADLIHRPKKALHTGSGLDSIFLDYLGREDPGYRLRSAFLYEAWKALFISGENPINCDIEELTERAKQTLNFQNQSLTEC